MSKPQKQKKLDDKKERLKKILDAIREFRFQISPLAQEDAPSNWPVMRLMGQIISYSTSMLGFQESKVANEEEEEEEESFGQRPMQVSSTIIPEQDYHDVVHLEAILRCLDQDDYPNPEEIREFFADRWERIKHIPALRYDINSHLLINVICILLADVTAEFYQSVSKWNLLFPTITCKEDMYRTSIDSLDIDDFVIVGENHDSFVHVQDCLNAFIGAGVGEREFRNLCTGESLGDDIALLGMKSINHESCIREIYKLSFQELNSEIIQQLISLRDGLKKGDVGFGGGRGGTEENAGKDANIAIVKFTEYISSLSPIAQEEVMSLARTTDCTIRCEDENHRTVRGIVDTLARKKGQFIYENSHTGLTERTCIFYIGCDLQKIIDNNNDPQQHRQSSFRLIKERVANLTKEKKDPWYQRVFQSESNNRGMAFYVMMPWNDDQKLNEIIRNAAVTRDNDFLLQICNNEHDLQPWEETIFMILVRNEWVSRKYQNRRDTSHKKGDAVKVLHDYFYKMLSQDEGFVFTEQVALGVLKRLTEGFLEQHVQFMRQLLSMLTSQGYNQYLKSLLSSPPPSRSSDKRLTIFESLFDVSRPLSEDVIYPLLRLEKGLGVCMRHFSTMAQLEDNFTVSSAIAKEILVVSDYGTMEPDNSDIDPSWVSKLNTADYNALCGEAIKTSSGCAFLSDLYNSELDFFDLAKPWSSRRLESLLMSNSDYARNFFSDYYVLSMQRKGNFISSTVCKLALEKKVGPTDVLFDMMKSHYFKKSSNGIVLKFQPSYRREFQQICKALITCEGGIDLLQLVLLDYEDLIWDDETLIEIIRSEDGVHLFIEYLEQQLKQEHGVRPSSSVCMELLKRAEFVSFDLFQEIKPFLSEEDFIEFCRQASLCDKKSRILRDFLNDRGVINPSQENTFCLLMLASGDSCRIVMLQIIDSWLSLDKIDAIPGYLESPEGVQLFIQHIQSQNDITRLCDLWDLYSDLSNPAIATIKKALKLQLLTTLLPDWENRSDHTEIDRVQDILSSCRRRWVPRTTSMGIFRENNKERVEQRVQLRLANMS